MQKTPAAGLYAQFSTEGHSSAPKNVATTRKELDRQLDTIRQVGVAFDRGDLHPAMACIAAPWPNPTMPAALVCLGSPAEIGASERMALRCLIAATQPAATPADVIAAAVAPEADV
jgi:DNA-binding IclR family transcriptional regulator